MGSTCTTVRPCHDEPAQPPLPLCNIVNWLGEESGVAGKGKGCPWEAQRLCVNLWLWMRLCGG